MKKFLAQTISRLFDPAVLAIVILFVAIAKSHMDTTETIIWFSVVMVLNGLVPLLFLVYFTNKGFVFDDTLSNKNAHRQRIGIFLVFLVAVALELLIMIGTQIHQPLLAVFTGGLVAIALALAITWYWKISMHASMATFFIVMLIAIYGWKVWPIILFLPLVFWSRIYLKRHTIWQLLAGSILALIVSVGTFLLYGLI